MSTKKILLLISLLPLLMGAARIQNESIKANAGINFSKLEALPSAQVLVGNASNVATPRDISGDATIANTGAMTIAANAVTDGKLRQSAGLSVIGRAANSTGDVADITAGADFNILRRSGTSIGFGSVDLSQSGAVGSSILGLSNGGSNKALTAANGGIVYSDADSLEILAAGVYGQFLQSNGAAAPSWATAPNGDAVQKAINQTGHGFAVGDVIRHNGTIYVEAQADSAANSEVYGIVSAVADANNFTVVNSGYISGLSGLTAGEAHFLSATTAGAITATEPTGAGQVSKPVLVAVSTTAGYVIHSRGYVVGSNSSAGGSEIAGEAYIAGTSGCLPSRSSSTFGGLSDVSACPGPTIVTENLGDWQTTDQNNIMFTINNLPAGTYMFILNLYIDPPTAQWCSWYLGDGTTRGSMVSFYEASANAFTTGTSVLIVTYSTTQSVVTFRPIMATNAGGTCYAYNYNTVDSSAHFESRLTAIRISQ